MDIQATGIQPKPFVQPKQTEQLESGAEQITQESPDTAPSPEPSSELQEIDTEKGVLRLLQQGHFKGVSDVRLRINFHDELAAMEAAKIRAVTEDKVNSVLESVDSVVAPFLESENQLTQQQTSSVIELHEKFNHASVEYQNERAVDLTTAFDDFVKGLRDLFAPTVIIPEETTIPETEHEGITESSSTTELPWQTFLDNLQSAFTTASDELTQAVADLRILPELSQPSGNGAAYEKFLAIYNELRGMNTTVAEQTVNETVDLAV
jgi:hypothetical protein